MQQGNLLPKGAAAEEILRNYFAERGYYVVRGIEIKYAGKSITDIDLWLYSRSSAMSREVTNVDIKNKKRPTVAERILWAKGVATIFNFNRCIVVSSGKNDTTKDFGKSHDIQVISGDFINKYATSKEFQNRIPRISEDDIIAMFKQEHFLTHKETFLACLQKSKQLLVNDLNFYGCNQHITTIEALLRNIIISNKLEPNLRLLYLVISYFLITLDYISKDITFMEKEERERALLEGLNFGEGGAQRVEEILTMATAFATNALTTPSLFPADETKIEIQRQIEQFPKHLSTFFSNREILTKLFEYANEFNRFGYLYQLPAIATLPPECKAIVGVLCDFFNINRNQIFIVSPSISKPQ